MTRDALLLFAAAGVFLVVGVGAFDWRIALILLGVLCGAVGVLMLDDGKGGDAK